MGRSVWGTLWTTLVLISFAVTGLEAQDSTKSRGLGIESGVGQDVPDALSHWEPLLGDWHITLEVLGESGAVEQEFAGEWNFHRILAGTAIQIGHRKIRPRRHAHRNWRRQPRCVGRADP